ncbi:MAG: hypothetical protein AABW75_03145 [Nanoarchaeota archaeon]
MKSEKTGNIKESGVTRKEIEAKISNVGDYVKMDCLQACLKKQLDFDTRKFVLTELTRIYEERKMNLEAGKLMRMAADINTTFEGKMNDFIKSAGLFIKSGSFDEADISISKALANANDRQKVGIKIKIKDIYKNYAKDMLSKDKRKHAMEAYEKVLSLDLDPLEKKDSQKNLLYLYEKLGKIYDYYALKKTMG